MSKLMILAVGAGAYVLGARAGREKYDQISDRATKVWHDPRVQQRTSEASEKVKQTASKAKRSRSGSSEQTNDGTDSAEVDSLVEPGRTAPLDNAGRPVAEHDPATVASPR